MKMLNNRFFPLTILAKYLNCLDNIIFLFFKLIKNLNNNLNNKL